MSTHDTAVSRPADIAIYDADRRTVPRWPVRIAVLHGVEAASLMTNSTAFLSKAYGLSPERRTRWEQSCRWN